MGHVKRHLLMNSDADWGLTWPVEEEVPESLKKKCTCGASIAMGKDDHWSYHSDYCDLSDQTSFYFTKGEKEIKQ